MTDSLILIQINETADASFDKPLLTQIREAAPSVVTFDFDTFSEASTRQYALDLVKQSRSAAVVVEATTKNGPYTGLVQFLNQLQQLKHPQLMLVQKGSLSAQLEKMMKVIGGSHYRSVNSTKEAESLILPFLENP